MAISLSLGLLLSPPPTFPSHSSARSPRACIPFLWQQHHSAGAVRPIASQHIFPIALNYSWQRMQLVVISWVYNFVFRCLPMNINELLAFKLNLANSWIAFTIQMSENILTANVCYTWGIVAYDLVWFHKGCLGRLSPCDTFLGLHQHATLVPSHKWANPLYRVLMRTL